MKADALLDNGDLDGAAVWRRIDAGVRVRDSQFIDSLAQYFPSPSR